MTSQDPYIKINTIKVTKLLTSTLKAHFTLGAKANVQFKSNILIGAKVEINPKGFTLRIKVKFLKKNPSTLSY